MCHHLKFSFSLFHESILQVKGSGRSRKMNTRQRQPGSARGTCPRLLPGAAQPRRIGGGRPQAGGLPECPSHRALCGHGGEHMWKHSVLEGSVPCTLLSLFPGDARLRQCQGGQSLPAGVMEARLLGIGHSGSEA